MVTISNIMILTMITSLESAEPGKLKNAYELHLKNKSTEIFFDHLYINGELVKSPRLLWIEKLSTFKLR